MTDHLDPLDELASAHLDGLTTAEEAARVAADPDLQHRVAQMRAVREALREPPPAVRPAARDAAIAAALAAAAPEDALAARRARRARGGRRALGIAAALVLLALAVPLLASLGGDTEQLATSDDSASEAATGAADEPSAGVDRAEGGPADAPTAYEAGDGAGGADEAHLGTFDDLAALEAAARTKAPTGRSVGPAPATVGEETGAELDQGCAAPDLSGPGALIVLRARAVLGGGAVLVIVTEDPAGERTLHVVTAEPPCDVLAERPL